MILCCVSRCTDSFLRHLLRVVIFRRLRNSSSLSAVQRICHVKFSVDILPNQESKLCIFNDSCIQKLQFSVEVPLCTISHAEKVGGSSAVRGTDAKNSYGIDIYCKDLRVLRFLMRQEDKQRKPVIDKLQELCFPASNKLVSNKFCLISMLVCLLTQRSKLHQYALYIKNNQILMILRYCAESRYKCRGPSPQLSAWATQKRRGVSGSDI